VLAITSRFRKSSVFEQISHKIKNSLVSHKKLHHLVLQTEINCAMYGNHTHLKYGAAGSWRAVEIMVLVFFVFCDVVLVV
jgi:hypothetical protein